MSTPIIIVIELLFQSSMKNTSINKLVEHLQNIYALPARHTILAQEPDKNLK